MNNQSTLSSKDPTMRIWGKAFSHLKGDALGMVGISICLVYLIIAIGVWCGLWGNNWSQISSDFNQPPSWQHWFGTNAIGQDVASRGVFATKVAFEVGLLVTLFTTFLGVALGALAGYFHRQWLDSFLLWIMGVIDSIPFYLFVAALAYAMQDHPYAMHIAMITVFWTSIARVIRAEVIALKQLDYIHSARAIGVNQLRILFQHILPNTSHLIIIQATLVFVAAIKTEVILSFLGLGIKNGISWGLMIAESTNDIQAGYFNNFLAGSILLFILIIGFNFFSDALQDALDPRKNHKNDI